MASAVDYATDLDTALALIARLRADREGERLRGDELETRLAHTQEELARWRERAAEAEAAQRELAGTHERMVADWRAEMAARTREFDQLQKQLMTPEEAEELRQQIQQREQARREGEVGALEDELEGLRATVQQLRRDNEMLRTQAALPPSPDAAAALALATRENERLRAALVAARQQGVEAAVDPMVRKLRREAMEGQARLAALATELDDVRAARQTEALEHEHALRHAQRGASDAAAAAKALQAERDSLLAQTQRLQDELVSCRRELDAAIQRAHVLDTAAIRAQGEAEEQLHALRLQIDEAKTKHAGEHSEWAREKAEMQALMAVQRGQMEAADRAARQAAQLVEEKTREAEERAHRARSEEWENVRALQRDKAVLEQRIKQLESELTALASKPNLLSETSAAAAATSPPLSSLSVPSFIESRRAAARPAPAQLQEMQELRSRAAAAEAEAQRLSGELASLQAAHRDMKRAAREAQEGQERTAAQLNATTMEAREAAAEADRRQREHVREIAEIQRAHLDETQAVEGSVARTQAEAKQLAARLEEALQAVERGRKKHKESKEKHAEDLAERELRIAEKEAELTRLRAALADYQRRMDKFRFALHDGRLLAAGVASGPAPIPAPITRGLPARGPVIDFGHVRERLEEYHQHHVASAAPPPAREAAVA